MYVQIKIIIHERLSCKLVHTRYHFLQSADNETLELSSHALPSDKELDTISVLHSVEGCALVMLCNSKPSIRRLAVMVLKEVKTIFPLADPEEKVKLSLSNSLALCTSNPTRI